MLGEVAWVGGHGKVGEQGRVVGRGGNGYARVGGGAGGNCGLGHAPDWMDEF